MVELVQAREHLVPPVAVAVQERQVLLQTLMTVAMAAMAPHLQFRAPL